MSHTRIYFESEMSPSRHFRTGVSLHSHTLHSKESLGFVYRLAKRILPVRLALERGEARYRATAGVALDLKRAWWTPPMSAHQAWAIETGQIADHFDLKPLVSLSDHDDIEAPMSLHLLESYCDAPVSVEWTVPYGGTFFHIGVHNLPAERARAIMHDLEEFTGGNGKPLRDIFENLATQRDVLVVFNHANWDEAGIGEAAHRETARRFAGAYRPYLHAFELNGLRPWQENRTVFDLAQSFRKPLISGGDRHAREANTLLNLSDASTFSEFVEEIRQGFSNVLITKQYCEPLAVRILESLQEILGDQDDHAYGWRRWSDRAFYLGDDGIARSLTQWIGDEPLAVRLLTNGIGVLRHPHFLNVFRATFARREEVAL